MTDIVKFTQAETRLVRPKLSLEQAWFVCLRDFLDAGEKFYAQEFTVPFADYVEYADACERGLGLSKGMSRWTRFLLTDPDETVIYGLGSFRYDDVPLIVTGGGHIGYSVSPSWRGRNLATCMCLHLMDVARKHNFRRVLVTCDIDNDASARVIEKCGGVLEDVRSIPGFPKPKRRYWITL